MPSFEDMTAINQQFKREECGRNGQLKQLAINIPKNVGLVSFNKVADQPVIEPECTNLYCQICFGIDGDKE